VRLARKTVRNHPEKQPERPAMRLPTSAMLGADAGGEPFGSGAPRLREFDHVEHASVGAKKIAEQTGLQVWATVRSLWKLVPRSLDYAAGCALHFTGNVGA
jgi:hypothetical protein